MPSRGRHDWLRRIDMFARPVTLRLDRQKNFGTPSGGCLTIFLATLLSIFLSINIAETLYSYTHTILMGELTSTGYTEVYNITNETNIYALGFYDRFDIERDMSNYFDTVYQQWSFHPEYGEWTWKNIKLVACSSINFTEIEGIDKYKQEQIQNQTKGMMCMNQTIQLQGLNGGFSKNFPQYGQIFGYFIQAPCDNLKLITNNPGCKNLSQSLEKAPLMISQMIQFTLMPNSKDIHTNFIYNSTFWHRSLFQQGILENTTSVKTFDLSVTTGLYYTSYNILQRLLNLNQRQYYLNSQADSFVITKDAALGLTAIDNVLSMYQFSLDQRDYTEQFDKVSIFTIVGTMGGLIFTSVSICNAFIAPFADYAMDVLMLSKLYSVNKNEDPIFQKSRLSETDFTHPGYIYNHLQQLTSFYYTPERWILRTFCHFRCCCRPCKDRAVDRIFFKARERLGHEMDLIQIIRQLRICAFNNQTSFRKQYQVDAIPLFSKYCVFDEPTLFDRFAEKPGQYMIHIDPRDPNQEKTTEDTHDELRRLTNRRKLITTKNSVEQVCKLNLERDLESDLHIYDDPIDMCLLRNLLGEDFDPEKLDAINEEIIDPPYGETLEEAKARIINEMEEQDERLLQQQQHNSLNAQD